MKRPRLLTAPNAPWPIKAKGPNHGGFTLIEVLISIVILSLLMTSIFTIVDSSIATKEKIVNEDREFMQIESVFARFAIDYTQVWSPLFYSDKKKSQRSQDSDDLYSRRFQPSKRFPFASAKGPSVPVIENPEKSELTFFSISNRRKVQESRQSHFAWIQYKTRKNSKKDSDEETKRPGAELELIRKYAPNNPYEGEFNWDDIRPHVLLRNVVEVKFEFWNKKSKKFVSSLRNLDANLYLPTAVRMSIKWIDSTNIEVVSVRIFRPLWPSFDTSLDKAKTKSRRNNNSGFNPNDDSEEDDDDEEDANSAEKKESDETKK